MKIDNDDEGGDTVKCMTRIMELDHSIISTLKYRYRLKEAGKPPAGIHAIIPIEKKSLIQEIEKLLAI